MGLASAKAYRKACLQACQAAGDGTKGPKDQGTKGPRDQGTKDQGTKGPRDQGTKGPRDQGTKGPRDHGTTGPRDQGTKGPRDLWPKDPGLRGGDTPDSIVARSLEAQESGSINSHLKSSQRYLKFSEGPS